MNTLNLETPTTASPQRPLSNLLTDLRQAGVQVWLDGDRLRYKAPKGALTPVLMEELRDRKADILTFLKTVAADTDPATTIEPVDRQQPLPASFAQERFWSLAQLNPQSPGFNMPMAYRLTGSVNRQSLKKSLALIVERHEILRTTLTTVDGQLVQKIQAAMPLPLNEVDLTNTAIDIRETTARTLANQAAKQPFDITEGPLLRIHLFCLGSENHVLLWNLHSIICDGTSLDVFFLEFVNIYTALAQGQRCPLPALTVQYADFAYWQRQTFDEHRLQPLRQYWQTQVQNLPILNLPTDYPRQIPQPPVGDRCVRLFSRDFNDRLIQFSQREGVTLFMVLMAAYNVLLYRYSKQTDLVVHVAFAHRQQPGMDTMLGYLRNTLIFRTLLNGTSPSFRSVLASTRDVAVSAYAHQDLPFEKLAEEIRPDNNRAGIPLFQTAFAFNPPWTDDTGMASSRQLPGAAISSLLGYVYMGTTSYDIALTMQETDIGLRTIFEYNTTLFDEVTILRLLDQFEGLLSSLMADPEQSIDLLPLMAPATQQQMLVDWPEAVVLDAHQQLLPTGIPGQVYLTEQGKAQALLPITSESAITLQISPEQSAIALYPTGQPGRRHADGTLRLNADRAAGKPERAAPIAPRDELERQLIELWEAALGIQPIGIRDNFFELGGYSLLAIRLFAEIQTTFGQELPPNILFQAPTVEALANILRRDDWTPTWTSLVPIQPQGTRSPLFFHGGAADALTWAEFSRQLGPDQPFYALQRPDLAGLPLGDDSVEAIAAQVLTEIRTVQPHGPYQLAGHCFGGMVMFEVAQQLRTQGEAVALLALIDAYAPTTIAPGAQLPQWLYRAYQQVDKALFWLQKTGHYYGVSQGWEPFRQQWCSLGQRAQKKLSFNRQPQQNQTQDPQPSASLSRSTAPPILPYEMRYARVEEACKAARRIYIPQPYPQPVVVISPSTLLERWRYATMQGWGAVLTGQVTVAMVPGLTGNLFNQTALPKLIQALAMHLKT